MTRRCRLEVYNPAMELTFWRQRPAMPPLADIALAVAVFVVVVIEANADGFGDYLPVFAFWTVPLIWRRRFPVSVFGVVMVSASLALDKAPYGGLLAIMVAAYSAGVYGRNRLISLSAMLAAAAAVEIFFQGGGLPPIPNWTAPFIVLIPVWLGGNVIGTWKERADTSSERADRIEREQELTTRAALAEERARIARELHDVLAHNVSVMVVQAGAARKVLDSSPTGAREAMLAVEATGREAMKELRGLLGVLGDSDEEAALSPQPGLGQVESLVRRVGEAGLPVTLRVEGEVRPLQSGADLAAYRIVQEALTNALKYSGLACTEVVLEYRETDLKVQVLDDGLAPPPASEAGPGRGLAGMRERIAAYGGALESGPRLDHGYAVRCWLPFETNGA
jgi:signal transduction histidine kinase